MFQKVLNQLTNLWSKTDGFKLLIGLILYFVVDHVLPEDSGKSTDMYRGILELVAYAVVMVGGGHKFIKSKYGQTIKTRLLA
jgi:hypothetical protein